MGCRARASDSYSRVDRMFVDIGKVGALVGAQDLMTGKRRTTSDRPDASVMRRDWNISRETERPCNQGRGCERVSEYKE